VAAGKVKVIELAKELGVTSKDLMVAAEEMGHKGVRAMTPLDSALANALRVKLGKGRELPEEPKPKRAPRPKTAAASPPGPEGDGALKGARTRKGTPTSPVEESPAEIRPAATIVKPRPVDPVVEPLAPVKPEFTPEPPAVESVPPPVTVSPMEPATAPPAPPRRPEPRVVPFRPTDRPAPPPPRKTKYKRSKRQ
jgi:translation initiation factor IF-2